MFVRVICGIDCQVYYKNTDRRSTFPAALVLKWMVIVSVFALCLVVLIFRLAFCWVAHMKFVTKKWHIVIYVSPARNVRILRRAQMSNFGWFKNPDSLAAISCLLTIVKFYTKQKFSLCSVTVHRLGLMLELGFLYAVIEKVM